MWDKIMDEINERRVAGPFSSIPSRNFIQSPIGLVPKSGNRTRLIFHLSYNFSNKDQDKSLNHFTPKKICSVKYNDLDHAITCCLRTSERISDLTQGKRKLVYLSKTDLRSAFRMLPVQSQLWKWLIFKAENPKTGKVMYFVDKCLPFGASISCALFQKFSNALKHIIEVTSGRHFAITNYLDDFLFVDISEKSCNQMVNTFLDICNRICLPVAEDKTEWASFHIVFLGILILGDSMMLSIPLDKRDRALATLNRLADSKKATVKQLQNLMGFLNFLSRALHPGQTFTRRIYSKFTKILEDKTGKFRQYHHVRLDKEFKFNCEVWHLFLMNTDSSVVCHPLIDNEVFETSQDLDFFSYSSARPDLGFGAVFNKHWLFGMWPPGFIKECQPSIAYLELFGLVAGVLAWEKELVDIRMTLFYDNQSVVHMINQTSSKCKNCMFLLRLLVLSGMIHNRRISAKYIKSELNDWADSLSRLQFRRFFRLSGPNINNKPTEVPERIWPITKIWQK